MSLAYLFSFSSGELGIISRIQLYVSLSSISGFNSPLKLPSRNACEYFVVTIINCF